MLKKKCMKPLITLLLIASLTFILVSCQKISNQGETLDEYRCAALDEINDFYNELNKDEYTTDEQQYIKWTMEDTIVFINNASTKIEIEEALICFKMVVNERRFPVKTQTEGKTGENESNQGNHLIVGDVFSKGDGSKDNPYIINSAKDLRALADLVNNGIENGSYYSLGENIDLNNSQWKPIGYDANRPFKGHFDGKGFVITKLSFLSLEGSTKGLFGYNNGEIENLGIIDYSVNLWWTNKLSLTVGGICGLNSGSIKNCYVIGNLKMEYWGDIEPTSPISISAGGIAACNNGVINCCYSMVDIKLDIYDNHGPITVSTIAPSGVDKCLSVGKIEISRNDVWGYSTIKYVGYGQDNYAYYGVSPQSSFFVTAEDLNDVSFYTDKLGWSSEIWDLYNIVFQDEKYLDNRWPTIK